MVFPDLVLKKYVHFIVYEYVYIYKCVYATEKCRKEVKGIIHKICNFLYYCGPILLKFSHNM